MSFMSGNVPGSERVEGSPLNPRIPGPDIYGLSGDVIYLRRESLTGTESGYILHYLLLRLLRQCLEAILPDGA
jgi:hypothetical protein